MLLKNSFLLSHLFYIVEFDFSWFQNTEQSSELLTLKTEMLLEFQNKTNIEITGLWLMHFRFALDFSDIDLWNKDMLDAHLNFLDTVSNKQFGYLHNIFKTCSRYVFLKDENFLRWRRDEEVFKTNKCLIGTCLLKYHRYCVEKLCEINSDWFSRLTLRVTLGF